MSGALIALGQLGFSVHSSVQESLQNLGMNIPFTIYILSPAIASYIVLKKNNKIADLKEWLKTVFYVKNNHISLFVRCCRTCTVFFDTSCSFRPQRNGTTILYVLPFPAWQSYYRWFGGSWMDIHFTAWALQEIWFCFIFRFCRHHLDFMAYPSLLYSRYGSL